MKKERKSKNINQALYKKLDDEFNIDDTRYWGLFKFGNDKRAPFGKVRIDPIRFQKTTRNRFSVNQLKVINARQTHYFYPKKYSYEDYNCNIFLSEIEDIKNYWEEQFLPLIKIAIDKINKPNRVDPGDYYNLQCGISSVGAAQAWATFKNIQENEDYKTRCFETLFNLYSQFLHYMASKIEAIIVKVLTKNNALEDRFDRNILYATAIGKKNGVKDLENFKYFDMLYCLWNFTKHNSLSTYETINNKYPELIYQNTKYQQGDLAIFYIKFNEELIKKLIYGCSKFFKEYCDLVFEEDYEEAQWNYTLYFTGIVQDEMETYTNPLGLEWYDDLD